MRLQIACPKCAGEGLLEDEGKEPPYVPSYPYWQYPVIELTKWPFIEFTCDKGHAIRVC